jgi:transketolase
MKKALMSAIMKMSEREEIIILSGDLGFNLFEEFQAKYPDRFYNMGIAEQNMVGVAAGLAKTGKKVMVYSIIPFIAYRALEQIRNDLCYPSLNVLLVGVGTGFGYGSLGFSHHAIEDVAVLRGLPGITIISPAAANETRLLVEKVFSMKGPVYLRLSKSEDQRYSPGPLEIGDLSIVKKGKQDIIFCHGDILEEVLKVDGDMTIVSCPTLKPFDLVAAKEIIKAHKRVIVVEEHNRIGGLGDIIREIVPITHIAVNDVYTPYAGDQAYLRVKHGLDHITIKKIIQKD